MRQNLKTSGYILVLAVGILAVISVLVAGIVNRVIVFGRVTTVLVDREQARLLAWSGVQIACAQLSKKAEQPADKTKQPDERMTILRAALPQINRWQTFTLTEEKEGIDGSIELYLACEQGKININTWYDAAQKKFIQKDGIDGAKVIQLIGDKLLRKPDKLFAEQLLTFLRKRARGLDDVTEIFLDERFRKLSDPLYITPTGNDRALLDACTVETDKVTLQPLLLSRSVCAIFGLKDPGSLESKTIENILEQIKTLPATIAWQQQGDKVLQMLYGKGYSALPAELKPLLAQEFESLTFSVVSYGKFGATVAKLYAILQKKPQAQYCIKKVYWL